MQRWDKLTHKAQIIDEKCRALYLKNDKNRIYFQSYGY